jgi:hypothetical protein
MRFAAGPLPGTFYRLQGIFARVSWPARWDTRTRRPVWNLKDSAGQAVTPSVGFLCDDVHIHGGGVAQEAVNGRHV